MAAINKNDVVAFSMPGGEVSAVAKAKTRPIDLAHLSRQTMGDRELEREVLDLFVDQAITIRDQFGSIGVNERRLMAHSLKGSARSVGAMTIAEWAETVEENPDDRHGLKRLSGLIDDVRDFIAAISR